MIPKTLQFDKAEEELTNSEKMLYNETSYLYDFNKGDFIYEKGNPVEVEGKEALEVWIEKALRTRINTYKIYEDSYEDAENEREYGSNIWNMIRGQRLPKLVIQAETQRDVEETLLKNDKILGIENYEISQGSINDSGVLNISFVVRTAKETFLMEVGI